VQTTVPSPRDPDDPLISVVVISYNFERYIAQCLDSVLSQTLRPYEVIVFDDCSTDRSWDVISEYAAQHPDLIDARRQQTNQGQIQNGAAARERVRGELFSVIDGDDYWCAGKLEHEWAALRANPDARAAYSNVFGIDETGERTGLWYDGTGARPPSGDVFAATVSRQFFVKSQSCYRNELNYSDAVRAIGGLARTDSIHADWDLKIRMSAHFPVVYSDELSVAYRSHGSNMNARTTDAERLSSMREVFRKNRSLVAARGPVERALIDQHANYLSE